MFFGDPLCGGKRKGTAKSKLNWFANFTCRLLGQVGRHFSFVRGHVPPLGGLKQLAHERQAPAQKSCKKRKKREGEEKEKRETETVLLINFGAPVLYLQEAMLHHTRAGE